MYIYLCFSQNGRWWPIVTFKILIILFLLLLKLKVFLIFLTYFQEKFISLYL